MSSQSLRQRKSRQAGRYCARKLYPSRETAFTLSLVESTKLGAWNSVRPATWPPSMPVNPSFRKVRMRRSTFPKSNEKRPSGPSLIPMYPIGIQKCVWRPRRISSPYRRIIRQCASVHGVMPCLDAMASRLNQFVRLNVPGSRTVAACMVNFTGNASDCLPIVTRILLVYVPGSASSGIRQTTKSASTSLRFVAPEQNGFIASYTLKGARRVVYPSADSPSFAMKPTGPVFRSTITSTS
ncbi:MAG: hypothetical protein BWY06_02733 [Candidatus Latescibacteria bacterium ADurb.Bin168]|nr:MAG: hypothetical protein BWY06_02733 [Candidatus Latescibacteria bacterium ADurb.Bin168]